MIERLIKSWETTLIGVIILGIGVYLLINKLITPAESVPFIGGLYGIYHKKKKKDINQLKQKQDEKIDSIRTAGKSELDSKLSKFRAKQRQLKN